MPAARWLVNYWNLLQLTHRHFTFLPRISTVFSFLYTFFLISNFKVISFHLRLSILVGRKKPHSEEKCNLDMSIQFSKFWMRPHLSLLTFHPFFVLSFLLLESPLTYRQMGNLSKKSRFGFNLDSWLCVPFESIFQRQYLLKLVDVGTSQFFGSFFLNFKTAQQLQMNLVYSRRYFKMCSTIRSYEVLEAWTWLYFFFTVYWLWAQPELIIWRIYFTVYMHEWD